MRSLERVLVLSTSCIEKVHWNLVNQFPNRVDSEDQKQVSDQLNLR